MLEDNAKAATRKYYSAHAVEYEERTRRIDMSSLYARFESVVADKCFLLDLGCGPGRDTRHFASRGYSVVAMDPCRELLELARKNMPTDTAGEVRYVIGAAPALPFGEHHFDAVWAGASLLHLQRDDMSPALRHCRRAMKSNGVLAVSLKEGQGQEVAGGRFFTYWQVEELRKLLRESGFMVQFDQATPSLDGRDVSWIFVLAKAI